MTVPWDRLGPAQAHDAPTLLVDLARCIGCHTCSVACKVEHAVPLGAFRMRVRWLEAADGRMSFLPLFDHDTCDLGAARGGVGMPPACVSACPTDALVFGDGADSGSDVSRKAAARSADVLADRRDSKEGVLYAGYAGWMDDKLNRGVALDPADDDITYEQR